MNIAPQSCAALRLSAKAPVVAATTPSPGSDSTLSGGFRQTLDASMYSAEGTEVYAKGGKPPVGKEDGRSEKTGKAEKKDDPPKGGEKTDGVTDGIALAMLPALPQPVVPPTGQSSLLPMMPTSAGAPALVPALVPVRSDASAIEVPGVSGGALPVAPAERVGKSQDIAKADPVAAAQLGEKQGGEPADSSASAALLASSSQATSSSGASQAKDVLQSADAGVKAPTPEGSFATSSVPPMTMPAAVPHAPAAPSQAAVQSVSRNSAQAIRRSEAPPNLAALTSSGGEATNAAAGLAKSDSKGDKQGQRDGASPDAHAGSAEKAGVGMAAAASSLPLQVANAAMQAGAAAVAVPHPQLAAHVATSSAASALLGSQAGASTASASTNGGLAPANAHETASVGTMMNTARVLQSMQGAEMRVGMHSAEFGSISIATSVSAGGGLAAQIAVDHNGLSQAITAHLPGMEQRLEGALGVNARVEVRDMSSMMNAGGGNTGGQAAASGDGGSPRGGTRQQASGSFAAAAVGPAGAVYRIAPVEGATQMSSARLSVRA